MNPMNPRRILAIVALSLGVVGGYGSAIAHARGHHCDRDGGKGGCHSWHGWREAAPDAPKDDDSAPAK